MASSPFLNIYTSIGGAMNMTKRATLLRSEVRTLPSIITKTRDVGIKLAHVAENSRRPPSKY